MAFITESNSKRIIHRTEIKSLDLKGDIYLLQIRFFSNYEKQQLLAHKQFLESTGDFMRDTYNPIELKKDSFRFVYEKGETKPAFHNNTECKHLNRDYENFTIPEQLRFEENGQLDLVKINEFRNWFPTVESLFKKDKVAFVFRLKQRFGIDTNPEALEVANSGIMNITNYHFIKKM